MEWIILPLHWTDERIRIMSLQHLPYTHLLLLLFLLQTKQVFSISYLELAFKSFRMKGEMRLHWESAKPERWLREVVIYFPNLHVPILHFLYLWYSMTQWEFSRCISTVLYKNWSLDKFQAWIVGHWDRQKTPFCPGFLIPHTLTYSLLISLPLSLRGTYEEDWEHGRGWRKPAPGTIPVTLERGL